MNPRILYNLLFFVVGHLVVVDGMVIPTTRNILNDNMKVKSTSVVDRRDTLKKALLYTPLTTTLTFLASSSFEKTQQQAQASESDLSFEGATFSDPINHPGGTRTIKFLPDKTVGGYQLAQVFGGGGRGEPKEYILPAVILKSSGTIIIDFSPKGK